MRSLIMQKRCLQGLVALACAVPLSAGLFGMLQGDPASSIDTDNHFRYLSGLLFGIGVGFLSCIPQLERQGPRVRLLTLIVVIGGLARLAAALMVGMPGPVMLAAIGMELLVTPALALWQHHLARHWVQS